MIDRLLLYSLHNPDYSIMVFRSSSMKLTNCTSKVLELAQKGIVREVGGYYGAIYECTHMHGLSSLYGEASS
ncbi:MAG: hypothetical protein WCF23_16040 [Candidatus Nitrosopolaris sp.]